MTGWAGRITARNDATRAAGRWRTIRPLDSGEPATTMSADGRPVVSFASNDYLGLTQHPEVVAAATEALARYGAGAGAARLIVGARPVHDELEAELADWFDRPAALLFPTGYQANLGVLGALADRYPAMDPSALQDFMARLFFIADLWGRATAETDAADR